MKWRAIIKGLALILGLAVIGSLFHSSEFGSSLSEAWIDARVRGHGLAGVLLFVLTGALFTAVGLPRQLIAFLGGYAFGLWTGLLLASVAAALGCALSFGYARLLGRNWVKARLGSRSQRFDRLIGSHPLAMTMLIRLLPVGNNLLTNLVAGVSAIRPWPFLLGSLLGYLPQSLVFALVGSGVHLAPVLKMVVAGGLFVVSGALGVYLFHRMRKGWGMAGGAEEDLGEAGYLLSQGENV